MAPILAEALNLNSEANVLHYCGPVNAVATALTACPDAIEAKRIKSGIAVGTENRSVCPGAAAKDGFPAMLREP
jgi:3-hydroxy-3-methylglutaryl CoA synthase